MTNRQQKKLISTDDQEQYHTLDAGARSIRALVVCIDIGVRGVLHRVVKYDSLQQSVYDGLTSALYSHTSTSDGDHIAHCRRMVLFTR